MVKHGPRTEAKSFLPQLGMGHFIQIFNLKINPAVKQRPRLVGNRVITPKKTIDYQNELARRVYFEIERNHKPLAEPIVLFSHFFKQDRIRKDQSNLQKALEDSMNGILYVDDYLIVTVISGMEYDKVNPRVVFGVMKLTEFEQDPIEHFRKWREYLESIRSK